MKKNYIILAHKNPDQLYRLINRLDDGDSKFYVHIDLKSNLEDFHHIKNLPSTTVIPERENCIWGDFTIVKATLHLLQHVIESGNKGYTILMSGQDYPVKSNLYINRYLSANSSCNFIEVIPIEQKWSAKMVRDKIHHYHFLHSEKKSDSNSYAPFYYSSFRDKLRTVFHLIKGRMSFETFKQILKLPERKPLYRKQYAGSQWWALNEETTLLLHSYIQQNMEQLTEYYRYTSAPDEIFFQSVLMNILPENEKEKIKPSLTYVNWTRKNCELPVTFEADDFEELSAATQLWARKFDADKDTGILDLIDAKILEH